MYTYVISHDENVYTYAIFSLIKGIWKHFVPFRCQARLPCAFTTMKRSKVGSGCKAQLYSFHPKAPPAFIPDIWSVLILQLPHAKACALTAPSSKLQTSFLAVDPKPQACTAFDAQICRHSPSLRHLSPASLPMISPVQTRLTRVRKAISQVVARGAVLTWARYAVVGIDFTCT